jgi:hypothetical protein
VVPVERCAEPPVLRPDDLDGSGVLEARLAVGLERPGVGGRDRREEVPHQRAVGDRGQCGDGVGRSLVRRPASLLPLRAGQLHSHVERRAGGHQAVVDGGGTASPGGRGDEEPADHADEQGETGPWSPAAPEPPAAEQPDRARRPRGGHGSVVVVRPEDDPAGPPSPLRTTPEPVDFEAGGFTAIMSDSGK